MVVATGSLSLSLINLQALIAASPTFQSWVKPAAPSIVTAAKSVYIRGLPMPQEIDPESQNAAGYTPAHFAELRPFSLINFKRNGSTYEQLAQSTFLQESHLIFSFEDAVDLGDTLNYQDAALAFLNLVGGVIDDMQSLAGTNTLANVRKIRIENELTRADPTEIATRGDYHAIVFSAEIGI